MDTEFEFSIFLDGKEIDNVPKHVAEMIKTLMSTGDVLFVKRNPKIIERNISMETQDSEVLKEIRKMNTIINDSYAKIIEQSNNTVTNYSSNFSEALVPVMRSMNETYAKLLEQSNEAIMKYSKDFSNALAPVMQTLNDLKKDPQTLELTMLTQSLSGLSSRVNDIGTTFSSYLPSMLKDKLDEQRDDIINHMISSLNPPKEESEKSVIKGSDYENELIDTIRELTKWMPFRVESVGKTKECCDIHVYDIEARILYAIEAKNYSNPIPGKEVEKFHRDLDLLRHNPDFASYKIIGMFLSKSTSISGHPDFDMDDAGNYYLAGENNNESMLLAIFMFCHKMSYNKKFEELDNASESTERQKQVLLRVYDVLSKNSRLIKMMENQIKNAKTIIKDAEDMKNIIQPVSGILEEFIRVFDLDAKKSKQQRRKPKISAVAQDLSSAPEEDIMDVNSSTEIISMKSKNVTAGRKNVRGKKKIDDLKTYDEVPEWDDI